MEQDRSVSIKEYRFDQYDIACAYQLYYGLYHDGGVTNRDKVKPRTNLGGFSARYPNSRLLCAESELSPNARGIYLDIVSRWESKEHAVAERLRFLTEGLGNFLTTEMCDALPGLWEWSQDQFPDQDED